MICHVPKKKSFFNISSAKSADEAALGLVSFQNPIQRAGRQAKKDFAASSDPQLQSADIVSKIDPIAVVAKAIRSHSRALYQALICDQNLNGSFCFHRPAQEGTKIIL